MVEADRGQGWSGSRTWHTVRPMIGPDEKSHIFFKKIAFGPEKITHPEILDPNLVRIGDRTSPPIIRGPITPDGG